MKRSQKKAELQPKAPVWKNFNVEVKFSLKYHQLVAARSTKEANSCVQTLVQRKFRELSGNCDTLTFRINATPIPEETPGWANIS